MWSALESVFEKIGLPYSRQGSYSDESEYPASFFTFWNPNTKEGAFYDDESHKAIWNWNVYYYTNDPSTLYSMMDRFREVAKEMGFIVEGRGYDVQSDRPDYPGRMIRVIYIENYQKEQEV